MAPIGSYVSGAGTDEAQSDGAYAQVNVATTATQVRAAAVRQTIIIQNMSDTDMYLGDDNSVTTGNGFKVGANGGTITLDNFTGDVYMIHGGAGNKVACYFEI